MKPGLTTLAILGMLNTWKDLMWPLINNSQAEKMTLAAGLAMLIGEHTTYYEQVMAGGVIAVLPLIVLFVIFQRSSWRASPRAASRDNTAASAA